MSEDRYQTVVVGGGPAGAVCAAAAAAAGATVLVLERSPRRTPRCAGLVSPRAVEELDIPQELILRPIRGARVHAPGGDALHLRAPTPKGLVVDRGRTDDLLLARAEAAGAVVRRGVAAVGMDLAERTLHTTAGRVKFEVLVGADGPISAVARWAGLDRPRQLLAAFQAVVRAGPVAEDEVEVFLGREVAPDFFAWAVPAEQGAVRVGLASGDGRAAASRLRGLLAHRFPAAQVAGWVGGLIPIGPPPRTQLGPVLLVGDAAGQVKPTSGGGLFFAARCARIAGEVAAAGPAALRDYQSRWRRQVGAEIDLGLQVRGVLQKLSDEDLDRTLAALNQPAVLRFLAQHGDIDYPSRLVAAARGQPAMWAPLLRAVGALGGWTRVRELLGELLGGSGNA
ncbi:MAG: geranylgeranyl reductase family protein [Candidatus Bipolaricaulaceae bacterium]